VSRRWRWRDWPWAAKLSLLLGGLALVPLTAVTLFNEAVARAGLIRDARAQNLQQARNTASILENLLDDLRADLSVAATAPQTVSFFTGWRRHALDREVEGILRQIRDAQKLDALYLMEPGGTVRLASEPRFRGRSYVSAPYFRDAAAGNTLVDEPRWDPADREVYLHAATPIRGEAGRIAGVAVARVRLARIDELIRADTDFAGRGEFGVLWNADGIRLSHPTHPSLRFHPLEPLPADVAARLIGESRFGPATAALLARPRPAAGLVERSRWLLYDRGRDPYLELEGPGGVPLHAAVVPLPRTRWLYGIFSPEPAILASVSQQTRRSLVFAAVTGLLAIALALSAAGWATRPLRLVGQAANALARGDMSRRVRLDRDDELGRLAAAFDAMADALADKEGELRGHATELERRVEEQTAALRRSEAELRVLFESEQEARRKAEEANRIKDEFLSTVSHELRTPLNAILSWVWLLSNGRLTGDEAGRGLATIERNARAQGQIIDDLLDVSRIITGKLLLQVVPLNLIQIIDAALDSVRPAADAKGIRIESRLDPLAALAAGDPNRLQQVVWNLLSNAVKFTPKGGTVEVSLLAGDAYTAIRVRDTGIGISPHFMQHVFDRFRQADSTTTRTHGGLGLGLAIVRHLVELHGGTVEAESDGEGRGAVFTVFLPVAPELRLGAGPEAPERAAVPADGDGLDLQGLKILLVDDEDDTREVLPALLARFGAEVEAAASTPEALAALPRFQPDVLVSDIAMPGEDGYALIRRVRALDGNLGDLPAIALTAQAGAGDRRQALEAGFQMHLAKPVEPRDLVAAVLSVARRTLRGTPPGTPPPR